MEGKILNATKEEKIGQQQKLSCDIVSVRNSSDSGGDSEIRVSEMAFLFHSRHHYLAGQLV